jgi:hypothetical protein
MKRAEQEDKLKHWISTQSMGTRSETREAEISRLD